MGPPMFIRVCILTLGLSTAAVVSSATAQSLWNQRTQSTENYFADTQARCVGDVITVLINETTDVQNSDQRQMDRSADASGGLNFDYGFGGKIGNEDGNATMDVTTNGQGSFDGQSQYNVDRAFTDTITATVINRLPNGNLVLYGRRERTVSGERRALTVSGVVRDLDVLPDNTVESRFVANFRVCYDGDGIESRFNRQGWLTEAWNKYRPF